MGPEGFSGKENVTKVIDRGIRGKGKKRAQGFRRRCIETGLKCRSLRGKVNKKQLLLVVMPK